MKDKIDIKDVLLALDRKDLGFYNKLTEEQKKSFSAWTVMRFASSANSPDIAGYYNIMINEAVNTNFNLISKHPELQWMLMAICGVGSKQYHPWIAPPKKKAKNKKQEILLQMHPGANSLELDILEQTMSTEEFTQMLINMAYTDKDIKDILK
jgi:hypothetical protein